MKRYNIAIDTEAAQIEYGMIMGELRIKITEAINGEWIRYEDVLKLIPEEELSVQT